MPPGPRPPIPPDHCKVAIGGTLFDHLWTQVFYLHFVHGTVTINDLQSIADEIASLWNTNVAPDMSSDCTLTSVTLTYVPSVGNELVFEGSYTHAGTVAGTTIADASACYVVQWKIGAYYRGGHPRSYNPGVVSSVVTNGSLVSSGTRASLAGRWNTLRNALNAFTTTNISSITMGTLSFQSANAWRVTPLFRAFTDVAVAPILGSQRRRIKS